MTPVEFVAFCLAASALVDVWFAGDIFQPARERVARAVVPGRPSVAALLSCWYCLAHWTPLPLLALGAGGLLLPGLKPWFWGPIYALAAARVTVILVTLDELLPGGHQTRDIPPVDAPAEAAVMPTVPLSAKAPYDSVDVLCRNCGLSWRRDALVTDSSGMPLCPGCRSARLAVGGVIQ